MTVSSSMDVLLNATSDELDRLGGDFTHYRDWMRLSRPTLRFRLVPPTRIRGWQSVLRRAAEKATRTWQPRWIRRRLFLLSRYLYLPRRLPGDPDLIFSHLLFPWRPPRGVPIVWNSQGISPARYYDIVSGGQWNVEDVAFVYRRLGRRAEALVVFTHACARNVVQWCPELKGKTFVVPAPVFVDPAGIGPKPSLEHGVLRLLFVGVDARRKGLPEVLEAYRRLTEDHPRVELDVVSRPTEDLQRIIATLKGARLHLSSPEIDVKALMAAADVFLLPTHADTYALAAVEALAHGCAVIISDLEPLPEVIPDGGVGFTVPAGDSGALYEKLARLASDSALLREFQRNARDRYLRYHAPDVVADELEGLFLRIRQRGVTRDRYRLGIVSTHPTQIVAPLYRKLAQHPKIDLLVAYCSPQGAERAIDPEFGIEVRWDVPLLDGYRWLQLPNRSPRPGVGRFLGLINPGLWRLLRDTRFDALIVHTGYGHLSYWIALAAAKASRTPLIFSTDAWTVASLRAKRWKRWVKPFVLPRIYRLNDVVAVASSSSRDFVRRLGVPEGRVVLAPNVVDNDWWSRQAEGADREAVRRKWAIPADAAVFLFCGKLQPWKRPADLLHAFAQAHVPGSYVVYVGEGSLRGALETEAKTLRLSERVRFHGFANQSELAALYCAADLLVLPSEYEAFGFVVNEAMLCGCPAAVSDRVGARADLVHHGENGYAFPCGDLEALARILREAAQDRARLRALGDAARERMRTWSPRESLEALLLAVERAVGSGRRASPL